MFPVARGPKGVSPNTQAKYCTNCKRNGHTKETCRINMSLTRENCGRKGHTTNKCRITVIHNDRPLNKQETRLIPAKHGLVIERRDHKNKEEVLRSVSTYFNSLAKKENDLKAKAKERRQNKEAEHASEDDDNMETEPLDRIVAS